VAKQDGNWQAYKLALGEFRGTSLMNVAHSSDLCSFLPPNAFGEQTFRTAIQASYTEEVAVDTVDNFIIEEDLVPEANVLLKMDTQGFDLNVFRGARSSLGKIRAMVSEVSLIPLYTGMPRYLEVLHEYEAEGFAVSGLYPISRATDLSLIEMDCV
jgi:FkbM family methyltransferase